jgi:hypothetical protein
MSPMVETMTTLSRSRTLSSARSGKPFEPKNPFDVDRDGHEHEPGQRPAGAGGCDE